METVKLKNGAEEGDKEVAMIMVSLRHLFHDAPVAAYELVQTCRNASHEPWGNTRDVLNRYALMNANGGVHDTIRNIVLSAVTGDGLAMTLGDPVAR